MAIIYRHLKPCGEVFYIGIGKEDKRAYSKYNRNTHWHNTVNKCGYEVQILKRELTWTEVCELEILLIAHYGRGDLKTGTLVNLTDGGEGNIGWVASNETRTRMSKSKMNTLLLDVVNGIYYKSMSEVCRIFGYSRKGILRKLNGIEKNDTNLIRV